MTETDLLALLRTRFATKHWPRIDKLQKSDRHYVIDLFIETDMHWLTGHFPQQPVVAGVVQTHWAGELAQYLFDLSDECIRIDNLKFQHVMLPTQALQLTLIDSSHTTPQIQFRYSHNATIFSEGKLVFNASTISNKL